MTADNYNIINPHDRDADISFDPDAHLYTVRGVAFETVTTLVNNCFEQFDADYWSRRKATPECPAEVLKKMWADKGREARDLGTRMHDCIEHWYLGDLDASTNIGDRAFDNFKQFSASVHLTPFRSEWRIYIEEFRLAGTLDFLAVNLDGSFELWDWKRSNKVVTPSGTPVKADRWGKHGFAPVEHLSDTSYTHYALQLSIYRYILEHRYGIRVSRMALGVFHPDYNCPWVVDVPYLHDEVVALLERRRSSRPGLPGAFVKMLCGMGEAFAGLPAALQSTQPVTGIRLNRGKGGVAPEGAVPVPWCPCGYTLPERPQFILDPALHRGEYYVQDPSSMAHAAAVAAARDVVLSFVTSRPMRYLDACSAPGGKTTAAIDVLGDGAFVVANEYDKVRTSILCENIAKWGYEGVVVTRGDAAAAKGCRDFFDIIAADVPCSGEGMMRKDDKAVEQWSPSLVAECAARQRGIVDNLWRMLAPGGCFIYSTCTFNTSENEEIVDYLVKEYGAEVLPIAALDRPEIVGAVGRDYPAYRFLPGKVDGEGQFIALLRKPGEPASEVASRDKKSAKSRKSKQPTAAMPDASLWLSGEWAVTSDDGGTSFSAMRPEHTALLPVIADSGFKIITAGISLGSVKGRDIVPSQSVALARALRSDEWPRVEVDREQALEYLRGHAFALPDGTPRGIVLLTTDGGRPLGFMKNIGNRANNLYPDPWRIKVL